MTLLVAKNLQIQFKTKKGIITAVRDVSFSVESGETLGVVGESGCGKSITNMALMGLLPDNAIVTADTLSFNGVDLLSLNEKGWQDIRGGQMGMIFQDPMNSLNPCYTVEQQINEVLEIHCPEMTKEQRAEKILSLLVDVGIPAPKERLSAYPHELSGGMSQRVMIAMAIACNPKLLIADEPTTALDVTVQQQILELLEKLQNDHGMSVIFVSHDLSVVKDITKKIQVMYAGEIIESGITKTIISNPEHPYTKGLLDSIPSFHDTKDDVLFSIPGLVPDLHSRPKGCQFEGRCFNKKDDCSSSWPTITQKDDRVLRCHYPLK
ncbi:MAG: peptide ABC transporter ATP-binding protein [Bacteriovorax sp. MedPE-SWde]|nr:MAG: peptide ABC transporter ATP-binding protein [Bacteriovorax sp. MedPE-SWde]